MPANIPTFDWEHSLLEKSPYHYLIGFDEVGRGAIAGPVVVAAVLLSWADIQKDEIPEGLKDSKLISEKKRPEVHTRVLEAYPVHGVGEESPEAIDTYGIISALSSAAQRAFEGLLEAFDSLFPGSSLERPTKSNTLLLLDGSHNWFRGELAAWDSLTRVKGDRDCVSMAAASLIAKVHRDTHMVALSEAPDLSPYGWEGNKGYGSKGHYEAITAHGLSPHHRQTWIKK